LKIEADLKPLQNESKIKPIQIGIKTKNNILKQSTNRNKNGIPSMAHSCEHEKEK